MCCCPAGKAKYRKRATRGLGVAGGRLLLGCSAIPGVWRERLLERRLPLAHRRQIARQLLLEPVEHRERILVGAAPYLLGALDRFLHDRVGPLLRSPDQLTLVEDRGGVLARLSDDLVG